MSSENFNGFNGIPIFNVFSDPFAKSLLRSDEMRPLLAHVLSVLTGFSEKKILKAKLIGGELTKDNLKEKGQIADIIIHLDKRRSIVIEVNQEYYPKLINKNGYYAMKVALSKRTPKMSEPIVWLVNIDKFIMKPKVDVIPQYFEVLERTKGITHEFTGYKSVHLPIDYIIANRYNKDKKLYQFAQIFNATTLEEVEEICKGDEMLMPIAEKIRKLTGDPNFLLYYDYAEAKEMERIGREEYATQRGMENGLRQGRELGIEIGRIEGKAEGLAEGKVDGQKILIKKMLSNGLTAEEISKYTELSTNQIKSFLNT